MKVFTLYTDGACSGNPGPGGWAVVSVRPNMIWDDGGSPYTTNNEMELKAVLQALDFVEHLLLETASDRILIVSDSQWAVNMAQGNWKAKVHQNMVRAARVECRRLGEKVEVKWIRGHRGDIGNEFADRVAQEAAQRLSS